MRRGVCGLKPRHYFGVGEREWGCGLEWAFGAKGGVRAEAQHYFAGRL